MITRQGMSQRRKSEYFRNTPFYRDLSQQIDKHTTMITSLRHKLEEIKQLKNLDLEKIDNLKEKPSHLSQRKKERTTKAKHEQMAIRKQIALLKQEIKTIRARRTKKYTEYVRRGQYNRYIDTTKGECKNKEEFLKKYNLPNVPSIINSKLQQLTQEATNTFDSVLPRTTNKISKKIILASGSKKRLELLKKMLIKPDYVITTDVPEPLIKKEKPRDMSVRIAKAKADKALEIVLSNKKITKNSIIIVADTVQCRGNLILDKAKTDDDVRKYINTINGRNTRVYTTICIIDVATNKRSIKTYETRMKIKYMQKDEIEFYIATKHGIGKAGGFSISDFAGCFVEKIVGSYTAVVGLPTVYVYNVLRSFGYKFQIPNK